MRGAWVEMPSGSVISSVGMQSLPVRGAWVEIQSKPDNQSCCDVAPRAGSVG